jgi:hypothetical protein
VIHTRNLTSSLALRDDGDGRTLVGPLLPWGVTARVVDRGRFVEETFTRGAFDGTDPRTIPLTATHPKDAGTLPIGVTVELEDRADASWGAWARLRHPSRERGPGPRPGWGTPRPLHRIR